MKIAIVTLPFLNNYGGVLQNFALQETLKKLGHQPVTLDVVIPKTPAWVYLCSWLKTLVLWFIPHKRRSFAKILRNECRSSFVESFIQRYIEKSRSSQNLNVGLLKEVGAQAVIVGSDQVWRPRYSRKIKDMYLHFCKDSLVKRVAYAASFGVDTWEYTEKQTKECALLAKKFDSVSVREISGIELCEKKLGINATSVLDPTLLLEKEDYCVVCKDVLQIKFPILVAYILNVDEEKKKYCENLAKEKNLQLKFFSAEGNASLTIPEWLAMFRDASYVVTDSFHGTVFSIIFKKEFKCLVNETRGSARFETLLELYQTGKLEKARSKSLNWLKKALES